VLIAHSLGTEEKAVLFAWLCYLGRHKGTQKYGPKLTCCFLQVWCCLELCYSQVSLYKFLLKKKENTGVMSFYGAAFPMYILHLQSSDFSVMLFVTDIPEMLCESLGRERGECE
jgi:hypothetical protein